MYYFDYEDCEHHYDESSVFDSQLREFTLDEVQIRQSNIYYTATGEVEFRLRDDGGGDVSVRYSHITIKTLQLSMNDEEEMREVDINSVDPELMKRILESIDDNLNYVDMVFFQ